MAGETVGEWLTTARTAPGLRDVTPGSHYFLIRIHAHMKVVNFTQILIKKWWTLPLPSDTCMP
jgi:hypothetical protein